MCYHILEANKPIALSNTKEEYTMATYLAYLLLLYAIANAIPPTY